MGAMMQTRQIFSFIMAGVGAGAVPILAACLQPEKPRTVPAAIGTTSPPAARQRRDQPIRPIVAVTLDQGKVALGSRLFSDVRLSRDNSISCARCHNLSTAGIDRRPHSLGIGQQEGSRNAPTVFNAGLNHRQFWDGRAASLEEQVDGPVHAKAEMATNWPEVVRKVGADPDYALAFRTLYPDGLQPSNIRDAIATFERSLITPDSPFDRYLQGNRNAISAQARLGYRLFTSYGCVSCHQGANVGGNLMQPFGVIVDPARLHVDGRLHFQGEGADADSGAPLDAPRFKVPGLRNVARTEPYFHDGSVATLPAAVGIMGFSQLGRRLPDKDINAIVAFLETLTGRYAGKPL